ncbi:MAG: hypothetical protein QF524_03285, partial [Planctomycetota bacterium]|nr:hypothetical protein [Planctomycetota bacterium]
MIGAFARRVGLQLPWLACVYLPPWTPLCALAMVAIIEVPLSPRGQSPMRKSGSFLLRNGAWLFAFSFLRESGSHSMTLLAVLIATTFVFFAANRTKQPWFPLVLLFLILGPQLIQFAFQLGGLSANKWHSMNPWEALAETPLSWGAEASWAEIGSLESSGLPFHLPSRLEFKPLPQGFQLSRAFLLILLMAFLQAGLFRKSQHGNWEVLLPCCLVAFLPWGASVERIVYQESVAGEPRTWSIQLHSGPGTYEPLAGEFMPGPACPPFLNLNAPNPEVEGGIWGTVKRLDDSVK